MKVYQVGGSVRDQLLGLEPKDYDYVVVGATEQEMLDRGFTKVGAGFPVFLAPGTGEEWALARKERKIGVGYNGFSVEFDPTVTLEEDLSRRDLTINAMAIDIHTRELIDPFNGREDLKNRLLRHVSTAFAEDPVRILRTARFAARYNFSVHPETMGLMKQVTPELNFVPKERIWAEFEKGLMENTPVNMFTVLFGCGAFRQPAMEPYRGVDEEMLKAITPDLPLEVRFGAVASMFTKQLYEEHRIPTDCVRVASAFNDVIDTLLDYHIMKPAGRIVMLERLRAVGHSAELLNKVLAVWKLADAKGIDTDRTTRAVLADVEKLKVVDAAAIAASVPRANIRQALMDARIEAINRP